MVGLNNLTEEPPSQIRRAIVPRSLATALALKEHTQRYQDEMDSNLLEGVHIHGEILPLTPLFEVPNEKDVQGDIYVGFPKVPFYFNMK
jgi:hypothetical protein